MDPKQLTPGRKVQWFQTSKTGGIIRGNYHPAEVLRMNKQRVTIVATVDGERIVAHVNPENIIPAKEEEVA